MGKALGRSPRVGIPKSAVRANRLMLEQRESISAKIERGFAQAESGQLIDGDAAIKMMSRRRAEHLKPPR